MPVQIRTLDASQWNAARNFLLSRARPLDAARFRFHFEGGDAEDVLAALAAFQNPDGGFGHALEPDLRTPVSSALATSVALQILIEVHAPAAHPLVRGAIAYLLASYDAMMQRWRIIPLEAESAPRAFWWAAEGLEERFNYFWLNPRAELVGALWRFVDPVQVPWLEAVTADVLDKFETNNAPLGDNELLCLLRLAEAPNLPESLRSRLNKQLHSAVMEIVCTAPERWHEFVLRPLSVAPSPDSPYAALLADSIQANLDFLLDTQGGDGAWEPTWSWAMLDEAVWSRAEQEWKGVLTLEALRNLDAWGRLTE